MCNICEIHEWQNVLETMINKGKNNNSLKN